MRRLWAAQIIVTVLPAFVIAPLFHVHMAEHHGHDSGPAHEHEATIHAHFPDAGAAPAEPQHEAELSHARHDAKPLEAFAIVPNYTSLLALPFLIEARIELAPAPVSVEQSFRQFAARTHDPPLVDPSIPRAPPA